MAAGGAMLGAGMRSARPALLDAARGPLPRRALDAILLLPILVVAAVIGLLNLGAAPSRTSDDSAVVAQVWSLLDGHGTAVPWLSAGSPSWWAITAWVGATDGLARQPDALSAAREAMVVCSVLALALLWFLLRRLAVHPLVAAATCLAAACSPLALHLHRTVSTTAVAVPVLLAAFVLAAARHPSVAGRIAAGALAGVAVLCSPLTALALPVLGGVLLHRTPRIARMRVLVSAGLGAAAPVALFLLGALVTDLAGPTGALVPASATAAPPDVWTLDPVSCAAALLAVAIGLLLPRMRWFAALVLAALVVPLVLQGAVTESALELAAPFAAVLVAGVSDAAIRVWRGSTGGLAGHARAGRMRAIGRGIAVAWTLGLAGALVAVVPVWGGPITTYLRADLDVDRQRSVTWLERSVPRTSVVFADPAIWIDLVARGWTRAYPIDPRAASGRDLPDWRSATVVLVSADRGRLPDQSVQAGLAVDNSALVARFGSGADGIEARVVLPDGRASADAAIDGAPARRAGLGGQLAANPAIGLGPSDAALVASGGVDTRVLLVLAAQASAQPFTVGGFPAVAGDVGARRQVLITAIGGRPAVVGGTLSAAATALVDSLASGPYRPVGAAPSPDGAGLLLTFTPDPAS